MGSNSNSREEILIADLPDGYVTDLGRPYITHKGLIALAHRHGIDSIMTELKAWSNGEAIVKATATGARGTYTGIGDANPDNVGSMLKSACIRMAETRAVNRALRFYLGIGLTSLDELGDLEEASPPATPARSKSTPRNPPAQAAPPPRPRGRDGGKLLGRCPECGGDLWDNRERNKTQKPAWPSFKCVDNGKGCDFLQWPSTPIPCELPPEDRDAPGPQMPEAWAAEIEEIEAVKAAADGDLPF